jgi:hypothetical protein
MRVASEPPEQKVGVPVPVNVVVSVATSLSPELIALEVGSNFVATTGVGDEQVPPVMAPYPTPLNKSFPVVPSVRLKVTLTPPVADAK